MTYTTFGRKHSKGKREQLRGERERLVIWVLIEKVKKQMNYRIK